jgi:hypothetical protein
MPVRQRLHGAERELLKIEKRQLRLGVGLNNQEHDNTVRPHNSLGYIS